MFLAEMTAVTGDPKTLETSHGAIAHALSKVDTIPPAARLGLFSGWPGIVLSAIRVAHLTDNYGLQAQALKLLTRCCDLALPFEEFDLIAGIAGGVVALIVLERLLQDSSLGEIAVRLGGALIERGERTDEGWSWASHGSKKHRNLTGLSHGTSGCAYAFLE